MKKSKTSSSLHINNISGKYMLNNNNSKLDVRFDNPLGINIYIFAAMEFLAITAFILQVTLTNQINTMLVGISAAIVFLTFIVDALIKIIPSKYEKSNTVVYSKYGGIRIGALYCSWPFARILFYEDSCEIRAFGSRIYFQDHTKNVKFKKPNGLLYNQNDRIASVKTNSHLIEFYTVKLNVLMKEKENVSTQKATGIRTRNP